MLEAGADAPDEPKINVPGMKGSTIGTKYDWNFTTVAQPNAGGRKWGQSRGKVLGGSSAMNLMVWDRASEHEYEEWEALGNPGWGWGGMLGAMLEVENFTADERYGSEGVGSVGPVQTLVNRFVPQHQEFFIPAMNALGVEDNLESLGGNPLGVMYQPTNIRGSDYKRSYSAHNPGYPSIAGDNLEIQTLTRVVKINLVTEADGLVATGVTLEDGSIITANKEVILSAGTFQSPGLLEASGIGGADILEAAGIPLLYDSPGVGQNLQDHVRVQISYELLNNYTSFDILKFNATFAAEQMALYNATEKSMYDYTASGYSYLNWSAILSPEDVDKMYTLALNASTTPLTTSPFEQTRAEILLDYLTNTTKNVPQLEIIFSDGYTGVKGYPAPNTTQYGIQTFTLIAGIQHAFSLGSVHITSPNLSLAPTINPNYLAQEYDIQAAIEAAKYLRKIANTPPLSQAWSSEYEPGLAVIPEAASDQAWRDFVINNTLTIYHPVGTCAMLREELNGVVASDLVVWGTQNLRVVDASVVPVLVSAHIQTAVYGIAERAAGMVVEKCEFCIAVDGGEVWWCLELANS